MTGSIQNNKIFELMQTQGVLTPTKSNIPADTGNGTSFETILREKQATKGPERSEQFGIKVSKHAEKRFLERDIHMSDGDWKKVADGLNKAMQKGAKESLFLMDDVALVMSVPNKTVITVVDKDHLRENVFTNIDSAVILDDKFKGA